MRWERARRPRVARPKDARNRHFRSAPDSIPPFCGRPRAPNVLTAMAAPGMGSPDSETPAPAALAILGGSFNPPHSSHLRIADQALDQLAVKRLMVIPSGDHPHKQGRDMAPAEHRLAMARLAFAERDDVVVDDRELRRSGPSFTVDTLAEIAAEQPGARLYFLIGSDNLPLLPTWHDHHRLLALATVVTWPRRGHPVSPAQLQGMDLDERERRALLANALDLPADDVAASDLRARLRAGERRPAEIAPHVADYLHEQGLYR